LSRKGNALDVKSAVAAGAGIIQYREKRASSFRMLQEARILRALSPRTMFLINDRVDICLASGADGVHIGQDDLPLSVCRKFLGAKKIIGVTVHSLREAQRAEAEGADYLAVSPIFSTKTKKDAGKASGVRLIRRIRLHTRLPLVAIGGIGLDNAPEVIAAGADCLCAISAVVCAEDVKAEIDKFQQLFKKI
jgi:thiamine-phosphate pyrophosphorylase